MKIFILSLMVLPMFLISCGDKKIDSTLNGTWQGETTTSDVELLRIAGQNPSAEKITKETVTIVFDDEKVDLYRTRNTDVWKNEVQAEVGTYQREGSVIDFKIDRHSCTDDKNHPTRRKMGYQVSKDFERLTLDLGYNRKIEFKKLSGKSIDDLSGFLSEAATGCYGKDGKFNESKLKKPGSETDLQKVDEIEQQAKEELKDQLKDETATESVSAE